MIRGFFISSRFRMLAILFWQFAYVKAKKNRLKAGFF